MPERMAEELRREFERVQERIERISASLAMPPEERRRLEAEAKALKDLIAQLEATADKSD
jgi:predicted nuclease with TOPRIM domain